MTDTIHETPVRQGPVPHGKAAVPDHAPHRRPRTGRHRAAPRASSATAPCDADPDIPSLPTITPANGTGLIDRRQEPVTGSLYLGPAPADETAEQCLHIDWPRCTGHGLCAEIVPELIRLDEWGYPVFDPKPLSPADLARARKAVQICPTLALRLMG
jgi:ferredoxin